MTAPAPTPPKRRVIELAEDRMVEIYEAEVDAVIEAILGHTQALVTDLSMVWDFTSGNDDLERLDQLMGRDVGDQNAYIWELARELRLRRSDIGLNPPRTN